MEVMGKFMVSIVVMIYEHILISKPIKLYTLKMRFFVCPCTSIKWLLKRNPESSYGSFLFLLREEVECILLIGHRKYRPGPLPYQELHMRPLAMGHRTRLHQVRVLRTQHK